MKRSPKILLLSLIIMASASCTRHTADLGAFTQTVYKPSYAEGFEILGCENAQSTLLKITNPWQGADNTETLLFISRGGEKVPEGFTGQTLTAGAKRIICMSSTQIAMLDAIGQVDRVAGVSGRNYVSNSYVRSHADSIRDVGYDGNVNYEALMSAHPDMVLLYGVNGACAMETKLREAGIPFCYIGEYLETTPLGKAEWMIAVSEITDSREAGEKAFKPIPQRYDSLRDATVELVSRPTVMLNTPYGDNWFMPSTESYQIRLIDDAGAKFIYDGNSGNASLPIGIEKAYVLAKQADFWLNTGTAESLDDIRTQLPKFAEVGSIANGRVFNNRGKTTPEGGNDYWESGVVRPDLVLHDLIVIFHPELFAEDDRELVYYNHLE